jgi:aryl-alcohol dehydrogenase-like predicted oxidoreductase
MSETRLDVQREIGQLGNKKVHRLGLACNYGIDGDGFRTALERGINYFFWSPLRTKEVTPILIEALKENRERYVVATGPMVGYFGGNVRKGAEKALRILKTDYIDVFQLFWLGVGSAETESTVSELVKLKEEGKIRAIGVSIHNRPRAGQLAEKSVFDMLMIRYNAAHPGAERDIFPHLETRKPFIVSYTATSWRKLLKAPKGWEGQAMTASDCYRFCLTSPHVDVVLTGPKTKAQLIENMDGVEKGPLADEQMQWIRRYGKMVHG